MTGMDKWIDKAGKVAGDAAKVGSQLVDKGRNKMDQMALRARLAKMQRQLGALVYVQRKSGDENEPMVNWYIGEIDRIKLKLAALEVPWQEDYSEYTSGEDDFSEEDAGATFRGDGQP